MKYVSYKYRLYPTVKQKILLEKHFGSVRWIYNYGINKIDDHYKTTRKHLTYNELSKGLPILNKQEETQFLAEVNQQSLNAALRNLDKAYRGFFKGKNKHPKFKSRHRKQSVQFPQFNKIDFNLSRLYVMKFREGIKMCI